MNTGRSFCPCSNLVFPAITDNDLKTAHLSRAVSLFSAFLGKAGDESSSEEAQVSLGRVAPPPRPSRHRDSPRACPLLQLID